MRGDSPQHTRVQDGFMITEYPVDPDPAFAFLVAKQELCFADLVFPTVTNSRENNLIWMEFTSRHYPDIFWVTGHSNTGHFKTSGNYPLHLSVWYKNTEKATDNVKELIRLDVKICLIQTAWTFEQQSETPSPMHLTHRPCQHSLPQFLDPQRLKLAALAP